MDIWVKKFSLKVVKHCHRLLHKVVDSLSLEVFKRRGTEGHGLVLTLAALDDLKGLSNLNNSTILRLYDPFLPDEGWWITFLNDIEFNCATSQRS